MKKAKTNSIWYKKYQPTQLEDYLGSGVVKNRIKSLLDKNDIPHLLFYGPAGTGKSTLGLLIAKNLDCDYKYINASDENGIDTIREKVKDFCEAGSFKPMKILILEEADFLTAAAQGALRNTLDEYDDSVRFIFTCNYVAKIIEPLRSRFEDHKIVASSKAEIARRVCHILDAESVKYELTDVAKIINRNYPDVRSTIKELQSLTDDNNELVITSGEDTKLHNAILNELKTPGPKTWYTLRQIIADAQLDDYVPIYRFLFDNLSEFSKGHDAELVLFIDEHLWRSQVISDKEITLATMFAKVLGVIGKKQVVYGNKS
jgi:replication factor C small subunit